MPAISRSSPELSPSPARWSQFLRSRPAARFAARPFEAIGGPAYNMSINIKKFLAGGSVHANMGTTVKRRAGLKLKARRSEHRQGMPQIREYSIQELTSSALDFSVRFSLPFSPTRPNTVCMPLFEGTLLNEPICEGLAATGHEITYLTDNDVDFEIDASLTCGFLIEGSAPPLTVSGHAEVRQSQYAPVLIGFGRGGEGTGRWRRGERALMAGFVVRKSFFERFGEQLQDDGLAALHDFFEVDHCAQTLANAPGLARIALANLRNTYTGGMKRLFLESNTLAFVIAVAELAARDRRAETHLPRHHLRLLKMACERLDSDLAHPPSTVALAREIGTNVTTLQKLFRISLGVTIFGYLQRRRLEVAQLLLRERAGSVSTIADTVGFASPAAFAAAYRRQFGYPPTSES